jgi:hypothetical protein
MSKITIHHGKYDFTTYQFGTPEFASKNAKIGLVINYSWKKLQINKIVQNQIIIQKISYSYTMKNQFVKK